MSDKVKDLGIAIFLMGLWFVLAVLLIKFMNTRESFTARQNRKNSDKNALYDAPPSYEEVMRLSNRLEAVLVR